MSAKSALMSYYKRQLPKQDKPIRRTKNNSPEKKVEKEVKAWLQKHNFSFNVIESKAVYSQAAGRYLSGQTDAGHSDISGTSDDGLAVYIELKAKGKRASIRPGQYIFLKERIEKNCFGVCIDSAGLLENLWFEWLARKEKSKDQAKVWLLAKLPVPKILRDEEKDLF